MNAQSNARWEAMQAQLRLEEALRRAEVAKDYRDMTAARQKAQTLKQGVQENSRNAGLQTVLGIVENTNDVVDAFGGALGYTGKTKIGSNGVLYFETLNGRVFGGNQYVTTTSLVKYGTQIGKYTGPIGYAINGAKVGYGIYEDDGTFGTNAQRATAGAVGGIAGAWAGGKVGAAVGGTVGASIGVWFFGVGAAPGAAIGSFVGGIGGAIAGGYYGSSFGESLIK